MRYQLSPETLETMRSPVAKIAVLMVAAAGFVLAFQILKRLLH